MEDPQTQGHGSLVIGGTGMLAEATRWMARHHSPTLLVARRASRFSAPTPGTLPLDLDWHRPDFAERIEEALASMPPLEKALLWLHDPEQHLARLMSILPKPGTVLVLGSVDGHPKLPRSASGALTVQLGSVATQGGRRWLTHAEICAGVIATLKDGRSRIVGELLPLS